MDPADGSFRFRSGGGLHRVARQRYPGISVRGRVGRCEPPLSIEWIHTPDKAESESTLDTWGSLPVSRFRYLAAPLLFAVAPVGAMAATAEHRLTVGKMNISSHQRLGYRVDGVDGA